MIQANQDESAYIKILKQIFTYLPNAIGSYSKIDLQETLDKKHDLAIQLLSLAQKGFGHRRLRADDAVGDDEGVSVDGEDEVVATWRNKRLHEDATGFRR